MSFPDLQTERLILNQLNEQDTSALFAIFSDKKVIQYYDIDAYQTESQAQQLIEFFNKRYLENLGIRWAIRLKENGQLIGTCGFNSLNEKMKHAGIGYELAANQWGYGYASEAISKIIELAFSRASPFCELYRIQGDTMIGNEASEAVLKKLGFKEEGVRRASGFWKGEFHDLKCFGLIKPEFKAL